MTTELMQKIQHKAIVKALARRVGGASELWLSAGK